MLDQLFLMVNSWMTTGVMLAAAGCLMWGMVSVIFSPCHMASIPLIVSYVGGQEKALKNVSACCCAAAFTVGLFITVALVGVACTLLGYMLGDVGPYWNILVGAVLIWLALDTVAVKKCSLSKGLLCCFKMKGSFGAFILGLVYGVVSGSCTFGFIAPILGMITIQQDPTRGILFILIFTLGFCIPVAIAGSSAATVRRLIENRSFYSGELWFRRCAGAAIGILGIYFLLQPFAKILE